METQNLILVTWDFTEKSVYALKHAMNLSSRISHDIGLIHIVKSKSEIPEFEKKVEADLLERVGKLDKKPKIIVKEGSIFSTIADYATETKARMVVMGTHGIKGMQKLLGSWALKVIAGSKSPFVVVQDMPKNQTYKNIVIPITYRKENKECINWAGFFSKYYGTKFHLIYANYTDQNFHKSLESNMIFINKYFSQKAIRYDTKQTKNDKEFSEQVITFAKNLEADAILIMTTRNIGFADYILGAQEQYIIANSERIPVICVNPKPPLIGGGFSATGG